jgi:hypothetical protein
MGLMAQAGDAGKQQPGPGPGGIAEGRLAQALGAEAAGPGKVHRTAGVYEVNN